jgi:hypothetical protein
LARALYRVERSQTRSNQWQH